MFRGVAFIKRFSLIHNNRGDNDFDDMDDDFDALIRYQQMYQNFVLILCVDFA